MKYRVQAFDIAGEFDFADASDFAGCLALVSEFAGKYRDKVVLAHNCDRCDYDTSGLTEDEKEAIDDAIDAARGAL